MADLNGRRMAFISRMPKDLAAFDAGLVEELAEGERARQTA